MLQYNYIHAMKCDFRAATAVRSAKRRIGLNTKRSAKSCGERESRKKRKRKRKTRGMSKGERRKRKMIVKQGMIVVAR